jgi:exosortase
MTPDSASVRLTALAALVLTFGVLYAPVFVDLTGVWLTDGNYSHGPLILLVIAYLVWARREQLASEPLRPSNAGLVLVLASVALLLVGTAGVEFFLMRTSAVALIAGLILFIAGWGWLRRLLFPLALTGLAIPLPPVIFYQAAFPLQVLATKFGVSALHLFDIPVLREGNVITMTHTTLEVTEACSGIRSLVSLFSLAVLYGYFTQTGNGSRTLVALSSIPIAILANGFRIAGTGLAAHFISPATASGFFHSFSGWAVFVTSFIMLAAVSSGVKYLSSGVRFPEPEMAS